MAKISEEKDQKFEDFCSVKLFVIWQRELELKDLSDKIKGLEGERVGLEDKCRFLEELGLAQDAKLKGLGEESQKGMSELSDAVAKGVVEREAMDSRRIELEGVLRSREAEFSE